MARTPRDPKAVAQEAADVAKRRADRLEAKVESLNEELEAVRVEWAAARNLADHAASHPLLAHATATSETQSEADAKQPVNDISF